MLRKGDIIGMIVFIVLMTIYYLVSMKKDKSKKDITDTFVDEHELTRPWKSKK